MLNGSKEVRGRSIAVRRGYQIGRKTILLNGRLHLRCFRDPVNLRFCPSHTGNEEYQTSLLKNFNRGHEVAIGRFQYVAEGGFQNPPGFERSGKQIHRTIITLGPNGEVVESSTGSSEIYSIEHLFESRQYKKLVDFFFLMQLAKIIESNDLYLLTRQCSI